ncbi:MAG: putative phage tail protein [Ruminiclostridium sp.]
MELLPTAYDENDTMKELQGILSDKANGIAASLNETINQCFVSTATLLLSRYEKIYGLAVDVSKTEAFRRERIIARARGTGTITKKMLEDVATSYSNGEVEVIENSIDYSFIVKFVGTKGIPANMADLAITIEEIKPAHLMFIFEYIYNTWSDIANMTWDEANAYTWEGLKTR